MTASQRQTYLKIAAGSMVGLLLVDWMVIPPVVASWRAQSDRLDALHQKVERGRQLIDRQDAIRTKWAQMERVNLPPEVSAAENAALPAIGRWARDAGIGFASLTLSPEWQTHDEGYQTLECRATATGSQATLGKFIYDMETDGIPVNLEEYELSTRDEHGAELTMAARFSFLRINAEGKESR
jgi:hypothetical protein